MRRRRALGRPRDLAGDPRPDRRGQSRPARGGQPAAHPGHVRTSTTIAMFEMESPDERARAPLRHRPFRFLLAGRTVERRSATPSRRSRSPSPCSTSPARPTDLGLVVGARTLANVVVPALRRGARRPAAEAPADGRLEPAPRRSPRAWWRPWCSPAPPRSRCSSACPRSTAWSAALALPASRRDPAADRAGREPPAGQRAQPAVLQHRGDRRRAGRRHRWSRRSARAGASRSTRPRSWSRAVFRRPSGPGRARRTKMRSGRPAGTDGATASRAGRTRPADIFADLRTGWSEFRSRTWLWVVVAGFCVLNAGLSGGIFVLGPVVADDTIGRRAWGFVLAAQTAGMIVGALVAHAAAGAAGCCSSAWPLLRRSRAAGPRCSGSHPHLGAADRRRLPGRSRDGAVRHRLGDDDAGARARRTSSPGSTPTTWSARSSPSRSARSRSARSRAAVGVGAHADRRGRAHGARRARHAEQPGRPHAAA